MNLASLAVIASGTFAATMAFIVFDATAAPAVTSLADRLDAIAVEAFENQ